MNIIISLLLLVLGFYVLFKAADFFVNSASKLGLKLGISKLILGLTIVAFGTSIPELFTGLFSVFFTADFSDFIVGTILGSNITNIFLIFGIFLTIAGSTYIIKKPRFDLFILLTVSSYFAIFVYFGYFNYLLLGLLGIYIGYLYYLKVSSAKDLEQEAEIEVSEIKDSYFKLSIEILISLVFLFFSGKLIIYDIQELGLIFGVPISVLTLTSVAIATSLPELAVTISAARKKETTLLVGNILGSNIINICLIIGLSGLVGTFNIDVTNYFLSLIVFAIATTLFSIVLFIGKFNRVYGVGFLIFYALYVLSLFI
ncbi:MAG: sodium:calcium antiporter [Nanoarchaeota archaeon]